MIYKITVTADQLTDQFCERMGWGLKASVVKADCEKNNKVANGLYCIYETSAAEHYNWFKKKVDEALGK